MQEWVKRTGTLSWQLSSHSQCQHEKDKPCPQLPSPLRLNQKGKNTLLHRARGENEKQREKADSASLSHWTKSFQEARNEKRIGVMWCVPSWGAAAQTGSSAAALSGFSSNSKINTGYTERRVCCTADEEQAYTLHYSRKVSDVSLKTYRYQHILISDIH